jgi:hypothetical protein
MRFLSGLCGSACQPKEGNSVTAETRRLHSLTCPVQISKIFGQAGPIPQAKATPRAISLKSGQQVKRGPPTLGCEPHFCGEERTGRHLG